MSFQVDCFQLGFFSLEMFGGDWMSFQVGFRLGFFSLGMLVVVGFRLGATSAFVGDSRCLDVL